MGNLKPGASYIYERSNGVVYAREAGADPTERFEIGRDYASEPTIFGRPAKEVAELLAMYDAAEFNPALQDAWDRVKMLYLLTKDTETPIMHHPV